MRIEHPIARQDDGVVDDFVDVRGNSVPVDDDGTFEISDDDRAWLDRWASGYDADPADLVVDDDADDNDGDEYGELTYDELYSRAQEYDIDGRSEMNSDELRDALRNHSEG